MAYLDNERSQHGGKPTELYKFEGTYENFFYTSGPKKVRYPNNPDGDWYLPIAIQRSEITCGTQDDDGLDLTVSLSVNNRVVKVYGFQDSPPHLELTIYRFHTIDSVVAYWNGPVNDIQVSNGMATIRSLSTLAAAMSQNFPNVYFQAPCNHVLYDKRCKVPFANWSFLTSVTSFEGRTVKVAGVGTLDGALVGGEIKLPSGEARMIVSQTANDIVVNFPFVGMKVADAVVIAAGCDLAYKGDCKLKFNNNKNFGGFPFIPAENPFETGIDPSIVPLPDNTCIPDIVGSWFVQLMWDEPTNPGYYPGIYDGTGGTGVPQDSPIFPGGGFIKNGLSLSQGTLSGQYGNFTVGPVPGGFDVLDKGPNPVPMYSFRWFMVGDRVQGYRWDFLFELDSSNHGIVWSHQFQRGAFNSGNDFPATITVGTGNNTIATAQTLVYRNFPAGYGINY